MVCYCFVMLDLHFPCACVLLSNGFAMLSVDFNCLPSLDIRLPYGLPMVLWFPIFLQCFWLICVVCLRCICSYLIVLLWFCFVFLWFRIVLGVFESGFLARSVFSSCFVLLSDGFATFWLISIACPRLIFGFLTVFPWEDVGRSFFVSFPSTGPHAVNPPRKGLLIFIVLSRVPHLPMDGDQY